MQVPTDESQQTHPGGTAPSFASAAPAEEAAGTEQIPKIVPRVGHAPPARRTGGNPEVYAVHCWAPSSAFANPSCNCLGQAMHPKLASRPTIKIIVGSWYRARPAFRRCRLCMHIGMTRLNMTSMLLLLLVTQPAFIRTRVATRTRSIESSDYRLAWLFAGSQRPSTPSC